LYLKIIFSNWWVPPKLNVGIPIRIDGIVNGKNKKNKMGNKNRGEEEVRGSKEPPGEATTAIPTELDDVRWRSSF